MIWRENNRVDKYRSQDCGEKRLREKIEEGERLNSGYRSHGNVCHRKQCHGLKAAVRGTVLLSKLNLMHKNRFWGPKEGWKMDERQHCVTALTHPGGQYSN